MKNNTPKVHIDSATFEESRYSRRIEYNGKDKE